MRASTCQRLLGRMLLAVALVSVQRLCLAPSGGSAESPCTPELCMHGGTCPASGNLPCDCTGTARWSGVRCTEDACTPCNSGGTCPCKNGGSCQHSTAAPGFHCQCRGTKFFTGQRCQKGSCPPHSQVTGSDDPDDPTSCTCAEGYSIDGKGQNYVIPWDEKREQWSDVSCNATACTDAPAIPHSNRSTPGNECKGKTGEVCAYQCDQ
eukprot:COSAG02_NODE_18120_length_959_cov_8.967442_2_plen_207_part_01